MPNDKDVQFGEPIGLEDEENEEEAPEEEGPGLGRQAAESGIDYGKKKGKELAQKKMAERAGKKAAQKAGQAAGKAAGAAAGKGAGAAIGTAAGTVVPGLGNIVGFLVGTALGKIFSNKTIQKIVIGCSVLLIVGALGIIFLFAALLFSTLRGNPSITGQSVHQGINVQSQADMELIGRLLSEDRIVTAEQVGTIKNMMADIKAKVESGQLELENKEEGLKIIGQINDQLVIIEQSTAQEDTVLAAQKKAQELVLALKNQIKTALVQTGINVLEFSSLGVRLNRVGPQSSHPFDNLTYETVARAKDPKDRAAIAEAAMAIAGSPTLPISRRGEYSPTAKKAYGASLGNGLNVNCVDFVFYALGRVGISMSETIQYQNKKASDFPLENGDIIFFDRVNHPAHPGPDSPWGHWVIIYKK